MLNSAEFISVSAS